VALFDEFIHSGVQNQNAYVQPGPAAFLKQFFRTTRRIPDTNVVVIEDSVIEEDDRISAPLHLTTETVSKPFMGYRPKVFDSMRSIAIGRVKRMEVR